MITPASHNNVLISNSVDGSALTNSKPCGIPTKETSTSASVVPPLFKFKVNTTRHFYMVDYCQLIDLKSLSGIVIHSM